MHILAQRAMMMMMVIDGLLTYIPRSYDIHGSLLGLTSPTSETPSELNTFLFNSLQ